MMWYLFGTLLLFETVAVYYLLRKINYVWNDLSDRIRFVNEKVASCLLDFQQRSNRKASMLLVKISEADKFNKRTFYGAEEIEIAGIKLVHMSGEWKLDDDYGLTPHDKQIVMQHMTQRYREIKNGQK